MSNSSKRVYRGSYSDILWLNKHGLAWWKGNYYYDKDHHVYEIIPNKTVLDWDVMKNEHVAKEAELEEYLNSKHANSVKRQESIMKWITDMSNKVKDKSLTILQSQLNNVEDVSKFINKILKFDTALKGSIGINKVKDLIHKLNLTDVIPTSIDDSIAQILNDVDNFSNSSRKDIEKGTNFIAATAKVASDAAENMKSAYSKGLIEPNKTNKFAENVKNFSKASLQGGLSTFMKKKNFNKNKNQNLNTGTNHDEWYTRFLPEKTTLGYVFDDRQGYKFRIDRSTKVEVPYGAALIVQLQSPLGSRYQSDYIQTLNANLLAMRRARGYGYNNYTSYDLAIYMHNACIVLALYATARRRLAAYNNFNKANVTQPTTTIMMTGGPRKDEEENAYASYKDKIDRIGKRIRANIQGRFPELNRIQWMFSNIFKDNDSNKYQMYSYVLSSGSNFAVLHTETTDVADNMLTLEELGYGLYGDADAGVILDGCIVAINKIIDDYFVKNGPAKQISADLTYMYSDTAEPVLYTIDIDAGCDIKYDEKILTQIQNACVVSALEYTLESSTNHIVCSGIDGTAVNPDYSITQATLDKVHIMRSINTNVVNPSVGKQMSLSRMAPARDVTFKVTTTNVYQVEAKDATTIAEKRLDNGCESIISMQFLLSTSSAILDYASVGAVADDTTVLPGNIVISTTSVTGDKLKFPGMWAWIDYGPCITYLQADKTSKAITNIIPYIVDVNNFAPIEDLVIDGMFQYSIMSLYAWEQMNNFGSGPTRTIPSK